MVGRADRLRPLRYPGGVLPADHWLPVTEPLLVGEAIANFVSDLRADSDPVFRTTH
ncbi:hypothetical protein [Nocardia cyriacigeorgica]|uniref:hypothetical protein n=1 Tax=Nocardia cyriacigeorgica TaxID=135487 RepID=UPI0024543FAD|nr:hypothetical protein [Nocardia cyriacigeorgica]